jgi:hypothetical protein
MTHFKQILHLHLLRKAKEHYRHDKNFRVKILLVFLTPMGSFYHNHRLFSTIYLMAAIFYEQKKTPLSFPILANRMC